MKFLVAVDGSKESTRALDHAITIADGLGASLTVVHAVEPEVYSEGGDAPITSLSEAERRLVVEAVTDAEDRAQRVLDDAEARIANAGVDVESELLYGDPMAVIPSYLERVSFEGVFVGHRGFSKRYEGLLGSVAKGLVERSPVPVTVVR
ncbi:Nucleotide-binding universal stress protein, UspA family [Halogranum amylolyticum]|uniref:Nucleotide-binding universal stress protein, UspA family n=1 Tax=Halogranum amylolyticum TaxID=660520 RepID=A0A1H8QFQ6_9EURY|nr:universal stress protein [Halogranum amylolyticum]SEO52613.1 Nucleotide-binding universal stress protein, UspA family [Halogranum amylolyticum]